MTAIIYHYDLEIAERVFYTACEDETDIKHWFIGILLEHGVEDDYELEDEVIDNFDSFDYGDEWTCSIERDEYDYDDDHITQIEDMEEWREWLRSR